MITMNHIDPNVVPQRSGNHESDLAQLYTYLYQLVGDLQYRLNQIEQKLEKQKDS